MKTSKMIEEVEEMFHRLVIWHENKYLIVNVHLIKNI